MEQRPIDANALRERLLVLRCNITNVQCISDIFDICLTEVNNAPTLDLKDIYQEGHYDGHLEGYTKAINEERPQGEWNYFAEEMGGIRITGECPNCKQRRIIDNFCSNCGADMRGEKK